MSPHLILKESHDGTYWLLKSEDHVLAVLQYATIQPLLERANQRPHGTIGPLPKLVAHIPG